MTRDDVVLIAREVWGQQAILPFNDLERFASLIAAAEREACAKVCEERQTPGTASVAILNGAADAIRARGQS